MLRHAGDAMAGMFRHAPGFEARIWRHAWMVFSGEPEALGNWLAIVEPEPGVEEALRDFVTTLRERGHPGLVYFPQSAAGRFDALATDLGLDVPGPVPLMVWRASASHASGPESREIVAITDEPGWQEAASVIAAAFGMSREAALRLMPAGVLTEPALRIYGARRDGRMISVAVTSRIGPLVYINIMATHPALQRQGAGRAVLERALADGESQEATHAYLISSVKGRRLYDRAGFQVVDEGVTRMVPAF
jgi:GNAT superfamily N-acetyltransferase